MHSWKPQPSPRPMPAYLRGVLPLEARVAEAAPPAIDHDLVDSYYDAHRLWWLRHSPTSPFYQPRLAAVLGESWYAPADDWWWYGDRDEGCPEDAYDYYSRFEDEDPAEYGCCYTCSVTTPLLVSWEAWDARRREAIRQEAIQRPPIRDTRPLERYL